MTIKLNDIDYPYSVYTDETANGIDIIVIKPKICCMTREEVNNISFKPNSHMSLEDEHYTTYTATYKNHGFGICDHQKYSNGQPKGKSYRHYMVDGKVFKSAEKFYKYIETL